MQSDTQNLPDDIPVLKEMVTSFAEENRRYEMENKLLREQVSLLKSKMFGRKTEKLGPGEEEAQQVLFDEPAGEAEEKALQEEPLVDVPAHTRRKKGRKPLPEDLPRVEVIHDLKEKEKVCCCGYRMKRIGQEVSEQLDIIPAKMRVIRHIRYKYACTACEGREPGAYGQDCTCARADHPEEYSGTGTAGAYLYGEVRGCGSFLPAGETVREAWGGGEPDEHVFLGHEGGRSVWAAHGYAPGRDPIGAVDQCGRDHGAGARGAGEIEYQHVVHVDLPGGPPGSPC